nr:anthocyanin gene transcription factor [Ipomoea batatas]
MVNSSARSSPRVRKGAWSEEEDDLLRKCIQKFGEGKWHLVPFRAANDVKNYWHSHLKKKVVGMHMTTSSNSSRQDNNWDDEKSKAPQITENTLFRPRPRRFFRTSPAFSTLTGKAPPPHQLQASQSEATPPPDLLMVNNVQQNNNLIATNLPSETTSVQCWEDLLYDDNEHQGTTDMHQGIIDWTDDGFPIEWTF